MGSKIDKIEKIEAKMIDVCTQIGGIAESNCHYTFGLARRIAETGKQIEELTVAELLCLDREYNDFFNRTHGG